MTQRFILITTAAILLAGCDRRSAEADAAKAAEISAQRQAEQAANDKIRQLEDRLNAAEQQKAADREAELARVKEELAQIKNDKDAAADRIRELQNEANKPAPAPIAEAPRNEAIRADLERVAEEDEEDPVQDSDPVYVGRVVPETQRVTNVEAFYEPLDQYGDWIQTDDYGYVFRPEVSRRHDWRPYTDGRWVHTGHGWAWDSNEDFGWATYHYGRWTRVERAGWVWVPGREWGPGWVSWRRGNDECGWAPLPPESRGRHSFTATVDRDYGIGPAAYVFISLSNFGARSYAPIIERPERNVAIINKTVNVTNITYNNTTNNTVVYNGGPSYDVVRARSKQPVENVKVNFVPQAPAGDRKKIVNLRQGDTFQIAAPPAAVAANTAPPRVKEKLGKTKEEKGWEGVDPAQAGKLKQEIAATSTDRPRRPRPPGGVANPNAPKPAVPVIAVPPTVPARPIVTAPATTPVPQPERPVVAPPATTPTRPERPVVTPPDVAKPPVVPSKPPQIAPKPETPARPAVVDKPRPLDPDATRPKPVVEVPPKVDQPDAPKKPADPEPAKMREPETARPRPTPEPQPKLDPSEKPKRVGDNEPRKFREEDKPSTPNPIRELPKRPATTPAPVIRERPQPIVPNDVHARPRVDAPQRVNPPVDAPARVRPVTPERPVPEQATPRPPQVAPPQERPAQVTRPVEQPVRRVVQPERPPQEMRAPVNRPVQQDIPRERVQRQAPPPPVVQRPPQPQAAPQNVKPAKNSKEADERKKKKDGEQ